ncbi:putative E3 ubiquitin-protein ligase HECTD1 [Paratrimastix pyriformis]|uniref:E3 ubiquitin-protein ligase HECTD1 n=1 Tax=Paratrimastix pyriformis TaxID=342808 RepID=A0ABQ8UBS6_9EUKA|nr:putative E3 ubiquitin-protein ligase HECTD1 [Paratrimastix pyriformis]
MSFPLERARMIGDCHAYYEDPVCLSCGDTFCRACAAVIGGICPKCNDKFNEKQLFPSRQAQNAVADKVQCHCPNHALGCERVMKALDVEQHLRSVCEWREEECDQCHQQVPRTHMDTHKQLLCARKPVPSASPPLPPLGCCACCLGGDDPLSGVPLSAFLSSMACGYADVGCPTRCAQEDLPDHERDGVAAHMGLLRQRLADTSAALGQTQGVLAQTRADLGQNTEELAQTCGALGLTQAQLAQTTAAQSSTAAALGQTQADLTQAKAELTQADAALCQTTAQLTQTQRDLATALGQTQAQLTQTSADLTRTQTAQAQTQAQLTQAQQDLTRTKDDLTQTQESMAQTKAALTHELTAAQAQLAETTAAQRATAAALGQTQDQLAQTKADLAQTKADLAESRAALGRTEAALTRCQAELAQTKEQTQHDMAAVRSQIDQHSHPSIFRLMFINTPQLFTPPAAPEGLVARWDEATKEVAIEWRPVPISAPATATAVPPGLPVRYRVQATLVESGKDGGGVDNPSGSSPGVIVIYTGPECRCRYRFPPGAALGSAEARFVVVAMRGLAESDPSATAACTIPAVILSYDHDMDEQGLFYYIGSKGRTQPWRNPAEAGWVTVTRSSEGNQKASDALGMKACYSYTGNQLIPSWWQVDLGAERLFTPTRYTIRHNNNPDFVPFRLQSWRLEGSVDGASWRPLDEHTNEPNAIPAKADAMATFAVERAFPSRYFRVLMTGPSPNGNYLLMLSGLEMYGTLRHPAQLP